MKIGILTFHNADNYGAVLQAYALQETLKKVYPDSHISIIDYRNTEIEKSYHPICKQKSFMANLLQFIYIPSIIKKHNVFNKFRHDYLNLGCCDFNSYDVIFYGSDQIWNVNLMNNDLVYFGSNFKGTKIAYGVSDGGELILSNTIKLLLVDFKKIFCRESSLDEKLNSEKILTNRKSVCDPVFFFSKEKWLEFAEKPNDSGYVLAYKISDNIDFDSDVVFLGEKLGKKVIQIVYVKGIKRLFYKKQKFQAAISPQQFVGYFANADFILTTSFHGTAFSIIFEKPFYVLSFAKRNERILDLLKYFNMETQWIESVEKEKEISFRKSNTEDVVRYSDESKLFLDIKNIV